MHARILLALALGLWLTPATAFGDVKLTKGNFVLPDDRRARILFVCPDIQVGSLDAQDKNTNSEEWIAASVSNLQTAIRSDLSEVAEWRFMTLDQMRSSAAIQELSAQFVDLQNGITFRVPQGTFPLAHPGLGDLKGVKHGKYDYHITATLAAKLRAENDVDYVMILAMNDRYSTPGRKVGIALEAALSPTFLLSPNIPQHFGDAMLVDLRDSSVVWFYSRASFGGDPHTTGGARVRIAEIMTNFPKPAPPGK